MRTVYGRLADPLGHAATGGRGWASPAAAYLREQNPEIRVDVDHSHVWCGSILLLARHAGRLWAVGEVDDSVSESVRVQVGSQTVEVPRKLYWSASRIGARCRTVNGVELVSESLVLRPASERDLDFYFELRNGPEVLARPGLEPRPRSEVERQLRGWTDRWQVHGFGTWTVFDRESDQCLGRVELDPIGPGWAEISPDEIEVGVVVHPTHWNRGIATEATEIVAADCFSRVGLNRLVALTTIDNKSSLRTLEKLGMRHRGKTQHESDHTTYELFELARPARQPKLALLQSCVYPTAL